MLRKSKRQGSSYALMVEGDPEEYPYDIRDLMFDHIQKPPESPKNLIVEIYPDGGTRVLYKWENQTWNRVCDYYGIRRKAKEKTKAQEDNK